MGHLLSKSRFIRGLQCEKALWLDTYCSELAQISYETRQKFAAGRTFESMFKGTFPNGIDVSRQLRWQMDKYPELTSQLLNNEGEVVLFEAGFCYDDVLVLTDVVHKTADGIIDIYEVKNMRLVTPVIRNDVYIQHYVVSHCLDALRSFNVIYRGKGTIPNTDNHSEESLFQCEDLTTEALAQADAICTKVDRFKRILCNMEPVIAMGDQCNTPYECPYKQYCAGTISAQLNLRNIW